MVIEEILGQDYYSFMGIETFLYSCVIGVLVIYLMILKGNANSDNRRIQEYEVKVSNLEWQAEYHQGVSRKLREELTAVRSSLDKWERALDVDPFKEVDPQDYWKILGQEVEFLESLLTERNMENDLKVDLANDWVRDFKGHLIKLQHAQDEKSRNSTFPKGIET